MALGLIPNTAWQSSALSSNKITLEQDAMRYLLYAWSCCN